MQPLNGLNTTSTMQILSLLTSSKFKPSMTLGWVQNLLLSLDTLGKTVSIKSFRYVTEEGKSFRRKLKNLGAWKLEFPGQEVGRLLDFWQEQE